MTGWERCLVHSPMDCQLKSSLSECIALLLLLLFILNSRRHCDVVVCLHNGLLEDGTDCSAGVGSLCSNETFSRKHLYYFAHKSRLVASLLVGSVGRLLHGWPTFTRLRGCKSTASSKKKMFMRSCESLLLAIPCFGLTGYGCLQSVTSFFCDRVEVPASSEPLGRINSLVVGWLLCPQGPHRFPESCKISFLEQFLFSLPS